MDFTTRFLMSALLVALAGGWSAASAFAQEPINACVTCTAPARTYSCDVLPPEQGTMGQSPQLFCASELAQANGHSSCLVVREPKTACAGEKVTLAYTGPIVEPEIVELETVAKPDGTAQPPKTLIEATERAVESTGRQIKKAGDAVGSVAKSTGNIIKKTGKAVGSASKSTGKKIKDTGTSVGKTVGKAAKSTWDCIVSLFQAC